MRLKISLVRLLLGSLVLSFLGCAAPGLRRPSPLEGPFEFQEAAFPSPLIDDADRESLFKALERSLSYLEKRNPAAKSIGPALMAGGDLFSEEKIRGSLIFFREVLLSTPDEEEMSRKIRENFVLLEVQGEQESMPVLLTGYYEPILEGSLEPGGEYRYPIYRRPGDLVEAGSNGGTERNNPSRRVRMENGAAVPYYSRKEIDTEGVLRGRGLELAWLKDPWDCFVLHVQGSGQVRLPDGRTIRVGFAASNGRPYRSIGRYLIDRGFLSEKEVSMEGIREFLKEDPARAEEIYNVNERYIFFRPLPEVEGPLGALGVPLTPGRSIATDPAIFPRGALAYLVSRQPLFDEAGRRTGWKPIRRFVFNQDAGAAIKGPARVDLFFGGGEEAGRAAGGMQEEGKIYFLMAK